MNNIKTKLNNIYFGKAFGLTTQSTQLSEPTLIFFDKTRFL